MSTIEYAIIVPSTDKSVIYAEVMSTTESVTIVPSKDNNVLFSEVMSTIEYVTIVYKVRISVYSILE